MPQTIEARRRVADARALARECAAEAISTLRTIMLNEKAPPAARISAATALLDIAYGKARQEVELSRRPDLSRLTDEQVETLVRLYELALPSEPAAHWARSLCPDSRQPMNRERAKMPSWIAEDQESASMKEFPQFCRQQSSYHIDSPPHPFFA